MTVARFVLGLDLALLALLSLYGLHRAALLWLYYHRRAAPAPDWPEALWPPLTVQIPVFNERYVVERVIDACAALDYPTGRLEIQVLDDSTDDTPAIARRAVERWRARGVDITHRHRADRTGFKAGALAEGLREARGELIAIFDADFVPPPDFLRRLVPHFAEPRVGMAQARWGHLNRDATLLTRVQSILLDGHFAIEHAARHRAGLFFNFNGTAGIWRRRTIEDAGGWQADTLTEDLDLSYRAQLRGWRFVYRPDVVCPAELPVELAAFKTQQRRWTSGSIQTARKILPLVWRADLPLSVKWEATAHLAANLAYLGLLAFTLLAGPALWIALREGMTIPAWAGAATVIAGTGPLAVFYLLAMKEADPDTFRTRLPALPWTLALGTALAVNNGLAVLSAVFGGARVFHRTAKYGLEGSAPGTGWRRAAYRHRSSPSLWLEAGLAVYLAAVVWFSVAHPVPLWGGIPFFGLFAAGYGYLAGLGIAQSRQPA